MKPIKAVALDVDGVLTDGSFCWGPNGEEWKSFHFLDIMGISLARKAGLIFALISGENSPLVDRYAEKMKIEAVYKGCKEKDQALRAFAEQQGFDLEEICFMGDDVNDIPALRLAGFAVGPANAVPDVQAIATITTQCGGGGAVRELLDRLLSGEWPPRIS